MSQKNCKCTVVDIINTLLDVIVEHGNLPICFDALVSISIAENEVGEYAILHTKNN